MDSPRTSLKNYVLKNAREGDAKNVVDIIDRFGWTEQWMMNVGDRKGQILDHAIQRRKPKTILELGLWISLSIGQLDFISSLYRYFSWLQFITNVIAIVT